MGFPKNHPEWYAKFVDESAKHLSTIPTDDNESSERWNAAADALLFVGSSMFRGYADYWMLANDMQHAYDKYLERKED